MDSEATQVFFDEVRRIWIQPEVDRRTALGTFPKDFKIYRARVLLPKGENPIVAFNDDIDWLALVDLGDMTQVKVGAIVYFDQIRKISSVAAPVVDGVRVAFVYLFKVTKGYQVILDFSPNVPELRSELPTDDWDVTFGPAIAQTLQDGLIERSVHLDNIVQNQLRSLGLWPAPALVPYPFQDITRKVAEGDTDGARTLLVSHCTPELIKSISDSWWELPEFALRRELLSEAIQAHAERRYVLSIPALLPSLEGLITDWMARTLPDEQLPFRQDSKTKKFRDLLLDADGKSFVFRKVVEASLRFILEGPVLASFRHWGEAISDVFPNRHVVEHGRHEQAVYTEENSVKLVLLLDTLHFMMSGRPLRSDDASAP